MANFNKVLLMGNLTRDPEVRYTPKGTAIATIGLAVNRMWSNEAGEKKEEVTFVDVDVWGKQAETIGQYMSKGKPIFIEGRLKLDSWDDKESGQKRSKLKVVCESFQFVGGPGGPKGNADFSEKPPARSSGGGKPQSRQAAVEDAPQEGGGDDNIPF